MVRLYKNAQNKLILINWLPRLSKLMKVTILYKFYDNIITSDTFMFSSDFAFIEIPIDASCKHGISFRPIYMELYHHRPLLRRFRCLVRSFFALFLSILIS